MDKKELIDEYRKSFSNYERTVWIVNSIHGHFLKYNRDNLVYFDRYPKLPRAGGTPVTPDFTALFDKGYVLIGEVKRALGLDPTTIEKRFEQLLGYDTTLHVKNRDATSYDYESQAHDLLLFVNLEYAKKEAKALRLLVEAQRKAGKLGRALVLFSATCDDQQARRKWILVWVDEHGDKFRDSMLPEARRFSKRHQDDGESIVIYPDEYTAAQSVDHFCNDDPPPIYIAIILWSRIFPRMIPVDKNQDWVERDCVGTVEFDTDVNGIITASQTYLNKYILKAELIKNVLSLLSKAGLVRSCGGGKYTIFYKKFAPPRDEDSWEESDEELKVDKVRNGLINALVHAQEQAMKRAAGSSKPTRRIKANKDQQELGLNLGG